MKRKHIFCIALIFSSFFSSIATAKEILKVGLFVFSAQQRQSFDLIGQLFTKENPEIRVQYIVRRGEDYKKDLPKWLAEKKQVDVLYWQAGERLYSFVRQGLIAPVDDVWRKSGFNTTYTEGVRSAVSYKGKIYGIPYSYYQWGFYYRKSLFDRYKITPPQNWKEFLEVCQKLKSKGLYPITIGTKNNWPSAAWFDYLNLRINGLAFHQELTAGRISFTSKKVKKVFQLWKQLIDKEYFVSFHNQWEWKQALPYIYHKQAGMILIGNFVSTQLPRKIANDIRFFKFPKINPKMPPYEEAPMDIFMLPQHSKSKKIGKKFLAFIGRADIQSLLNNNIGKIPPNQKAKLGNDYFIRVGFKILNEAKGLSQFFDRDTNKKMADAGIRIFTDFMIKSNIEETVQKLEEVRKKSFNFKNSSF